MAGWVKLHRKIKKSAMYKALNSKQRDVLVQVLLLANHDENSWEWKGEIFKCKPGQFITSLDGLASECASDVKVQSVRTALLKLEKWQFLTNESTKTGRLITVVNWECYQGGGDDANNQPNKQLTKLQQSSNKALTTNKNVKNDKNDKEEKNNTLHVDGVPGGSKPAKTPQPKFDPKKYLLKLGVTEQVVVDWFAIRARKKLPPTKTAIDGVIREAVAAKMPISEAIKMCCENGWAGFKAIWAANIAAATPVTQDIVPTAEEEADLERIRLKAETLKKQRQQLEDAA